MPISAAESAPYPVAIAPGETRVLRFPHQVSGVIVGHPELVGATVAGRDVRLSARAARGSTLVVVRSGGATTVWKAEIGPHPPLPSRIDVTEPARPAAGPHPGAQDHAPAHRLVETVTVLMPDAPSQPARAPSPAAASGQAPAGNAAMPAPPAGGAGAPTAQGAPLPDSPGASASPPPPASTAAPAHDAQADALPARPPARPGARVLFARADGAPPGIDVTASASETDGGIAVEYEIRNATKAELADPHVAATDGLGHPVPVTPVARVTAVPPWSRAAGTVLVGKAAFPIVLEWTWRAVTTSRLWILETRADAGPARFRIAVTP